MPLIRLRVVNFKRLEEVDIELGDVVVFIGPNNSGKTSALQALLLWSAGVKEWAAQRRTGIPGKRPGITMSRLGLTQIPLRETKHLWRNLHVVDVAKNGGEQKTRPVYLDVTVSGETSFKPWTCGLEFYYANPESFYCRPLRPEAFGGSDRLAVPEEARDVNIALLPPLSGISPEEAELKSGRISVLLGEGRSGEVLRNLCLQVKETDGGRWESVKRGVQDMFGIRIGDPVRDAARGIIELDYEEHGVVFDITSAGRGLQQVLLLLAHMNGNPGAVLLLDEPDAHLEVIRQREVYGFLTDQARHTGSQLIIASHSEVVLTEAADRDMLFSFAGRPRRIDDRGSQVLKSLRDIRADDYYQADRKKFVLYLEGSTDLAILKGIARLIGHPASRILEEPFVQYVGNLPNKVSEHFFGLKAATPELRAFALFDRLPRGLPADFTVPNHIWRRREIENYLASRDVLLRFASGKSQLDLVSMAEQARGREAMAAAISEVETAFRALRRDAWSFEEKISDDVLPPIFANFYERLGVSDRMRKSDYHILVDSLTPDAVDQEVVDMLDHLVTAASPVRPHEGQS